MSHKAEKRRLRPLQWCSIGIFMLALCLIVYEIGWGHFLVGKNFGPGAYYFTDVPGWQHLFLESPFLGFQHPVLAAMFFIGWSLFMYKMLCWLNDKL